MADMDNDDRNDRNDRNDRGGNGRGRSGRHSRRRRVSRLTAERIDYIDYKDVKLLQRYLNSYGKIETRKRTGTCLKHQRRVALALDDAAVQCDQDVFRGEGVIEDADLATAQGRVDGVADALDLNDAPLAVNPSGKASCAECVCSLAQSNQGRSRGSCQRRSDAIASFVCWARGPSSRFCSGCVCAMTAPVPITKATAAVPSQLILMEELLCSPVHSRGRATLAASIGSALTAVNTDRRQERDLRRPARPCGGTSRS